MKTLTPWLLAGFAVITLGATAARAADPIKVMIIGGQNNHNWKVSTPYLKELLDRKPQFQATVCNAPEKDADQAAWDAWQPKFSDYDVILLDYNGQMWPQRVKEDFVNYV
ncbi:MAG: ThuA domain-containing protein, partial [Planctomycetes bacterium]|nr:ThuA domain-containing protein [Planctomycetota bacterium]